MQSVLAVLAIIVIDDGLRGPPVGPLNLAGVAPWIHWRGCLMFGFLILGNVFCFACPFALPRAAARRWLPRRFEWPRALRNKWLAVVLLAVFLWSYEAHALWDNPWLTAWLAIAYFVAAAVVDGLFRGAAFCKYVCPIGQFNFLQSLVSPLEVKVRDAGHLRRLSHARVHPRPPNVVGCEMHLFQPHKVGNLDCTFCLDCVHACPHANVGLLAVVPGATLWQRRVSLGRRLAACAAQIWRRSCWWCRSARW